MKEEIKIFFFIVAIIILSMILMSFSQKNPSVYNACISSCLNGGFGEKFCREYCAPFKDLPSPDDDGDEFFKV